MTGGKKPYTYQWLADGTAIADADGATLAITEDMVGKKISVKVTDADSNTKTSDESAAVSYVYPELVTAVRKAANSFTANFDSYASEIVKADDIEVISEDGTDVKKITGLDFSLDGTSAVVTVNTPFKDGVTYNVNYGDSTASFVASVGEVASIVISTSEAEVNTKTPIEFALIDENGVDVTSAYDRDKTCTVTFSGDYSNYENTKASASTVTMATAGNVCEVTVTYNKNDGVTEPVVQSHEILCVAASEKSGIPYFKAAPDDLNNTDLCYRFYDPANSADTTVSVAINKTKTVHWYAQDTDGSAIKYDSYEIESADETIANVEIDVATGKWASFDVTGNQKGTVLLTLKATKNGATKTYEIPVTVTTQAVPKSVQLKLTKATMSNAWDEDYYGEVSMKVLAADGSEADPDTYNVHDFELVNKNTPVDDDLKGDALYDGDANTGFKLRATDKAKMKAKYTAFAAATDSYTIKGIVTDNTTGKTIDNRASVEVKELGKDAWYTSAAAAEDALGGLDLYQLKKAGDAVTPTVADTTTGLTTVQSQAYPLLTPEEFAKLKPHTVKAGEKDADVTPVLNTNDGGANYSTDAKLGEGYTAVTATSGSIAAKKWVLVYKDGNGDYQPILTAGTNNDEPADETLFGLAAPTKKADKTTIIKVTNSSDTTLQNATSAANVKKYGTELVDSKLFATAPRYATRLELGQDAYDVNPNATTTNFKGVDAEYAVEMDKTMGYKEKTSQKKAKLYATMGGLFAGYVNEDGSIGTGTAVTGHVVASIPTRIMNLNVCPSSVTPNKATDNYWGLGVETWWGQTIVGAAHDDDILDPTDLTISELFGVGAGKASTATRDTTNVDRVEQTFITVNSAPTGGTADFYAAQREQITHDDDFAREGEYTVKFSFWCVKSTKPIEESAKFTVKNDLYVPGVQVKTQTLESYSQSGWAEAVVSEVDLNNNDPSTYSVIDLTDANGVTINDKKTPAHWAVITEEGILFHKILDRTFKLS